MASFIRKFLLIVAAVVALSAFFIVYTFWLSPEAREGSQNRKNIQQVKIGMTQQELLHIMGPPKLIRDPFDWKEGTQKEGQIYLYQSPPLASSDFGFYIDGDSIVRTINYGD